MSEPRQASEDLSQIDAGNQAGGQAGSPTAAPTAAQLRAEFDLTFTLPTRQSTGAARDFVILQVAGQRYALAAQNLRGIERTSDRESDNIRESDKLRGGDERANQRPHSDREDGFRIGSSTSLEGGRSSAMEWVRVPSTQPALLGIRAFSGRIVPVFALAALLGLHGSTQPTHCALVPCGEDLVGFAFDALLRFARIEPEQFFAPGAAAQPWEEATLSDSGEVFAVIGMPALLRILELAIQTPLSSPLQSHESHENPSVQIGKS